MLAAEKGLPSAVPCTSMNSPAPVMTTFEVDVGLAVLPIAEVQARLARRPCPRLPGGYGVKQGGSLQDAVFD